MKLAKFWTKETGAATGSDGNQIQVVSRGWSNESIEAARNVAKETARRLAESIAAGEGRRQYGYGDRPLPEPVVREFGSGGPDPAAITTRNAYGALVLNTRDLMFIDIDRDDDSSSSAASDLVSSVMSLFGKTSPVQPKSSAVLDGIQRISEENRLSVRVYKTAAGYRAMVTSAAFKAASPQSETLLKQFGSDPLYIRLCSMQESFRARLTPKPWRCKLRTPPATFPFTTPEEESRFRDWEARYSSAISQYATCRYLDTFGGVSIAPDFEELIQYHDRETRAVSPLPLA